MYYYVDLNLMPPMYVDGHAIAMLPDYLTTQFPCQMQCKMNIVSLSYENKELELCTHATAYTV